MGDTEVTEVTFFSKEHLKVLKGNDGILNCRVKYNESKSKLPCKSVNSISVKSIRDVRKKKLSFLAT